MERINFLLDKYKSASDDLLSYLGNLFGFIDFKGDDYHKIPKRIKESDCNIDFNFNKKIVISGVIVGVVKKSHKIRVYNPRSKKMYFVDCSDVIKVYN
jgi:hypothetical protein